MKQQDWVSSHPLRTPDFSTRSFHLDNIQDDYYGSDHSTFCEHIPEARVACSPIPSSSGNGGVDTMKSSFQSELQFLRGLAPQISEESLWKMFVLHNYQVDQTIDAVLAEAIIMEGNCGGDNQPLESQSVGDQQSSEAALKAIILSDLRKGQSIQSIMMDIERRKVAQREVLIHKDETRGTRMPLPRSFLKIPQFRLILNELSNGYVDFTICFRRNNEKLGITVKEVNAEIVVTTLHLSERGETMLAERAGVQVDDILLGINGELFSPWPELQDVIELLSVSGPFVVIHLRRKLAMHRVDIDSMHPAIKLLLEQRVITKSKTEIVDRLLARFKHRIIEWNDATISDRIYNWRLDLLDSTPSINTLSSVSTKEISALSASSISGGDRRKSLGVLGRANSDKQRRRMTISYSSSPFFHPVPHHGLPLFQLNHIRPALSVRILRAETSKAGDHTEYVIWVNDVKSGIEWIVRRRFREFFEFRETLVMIRPSLKCLEFPPKRLSVESSGLIQERIPMLQKFLRNVCGVITMNEYHPSTIKIQLALQRFLAVEDRIHLIILQDSDLKFSSLTRYVQIYIHSIMHMSIMDKVIYGFVDTFMAHQVDDVSKTWTEAECNLICEELRLFLDHVQNFLFDCFYEDCLEIINHHKQLTNIFAPQTNQLLRKLKFNHSSTSDKVCSSDESNAPTSFQSEHIDTGVMTKDASDGSGCEYSVQQLCDMVLLVNQDELRSVIRSAMRKQVEIDIYLGCVGRMAYIMHETLKSVSETFSSKIAKLLPYPQSYYGIPIQHISPSSWGTVVSSFRAVANHTLPFDKIEGILQVSKSLLVLFQVEHADAEKPIGADELLPIFIYIVVQSQLPNLVVINHELQALCDQDKVMSETGYYLATLQASISHILDADLGKPRPFSN